MQRNWIVRQFSERDEAEVIELLRLVGFSTSTHEMWRWKFKENPKGFIGTVGVSGDKIVGYMGLILVDMKIGNTIFQGAQAVSLAVHPNFRRQGMFLEIGKALMKDAAHKNIPVTYGVPNEPAFHGHLKYGWFLVGEIPVLTKFLSRKALAKFLLKRLFCFRALMKQPFKFLKTFFGWFCYLFSKFGWRQIKPQEGVKIYELTLFDSNVDMLWKRVSGNYNVAIVRSRKYLNWRYFDRANSPYKVFAININNNLEGYIVLSIQQSPGLGYEAYIVDLLASSNAALENLLIFTLDYCQKYDVSKVSCWMLQHHHAYSQMVDLGFKLDKTNDVVRLIARINSHNQEFMKLHKIQNWLFMMGDSDMI